MKAKNTVGYIVVLLVAISTLFSCHSDENKDDVDDVQDTLKEGTWRISYFYHSGTDKTESYAGYTFIFAGNTVMTASKEDNSYTGQWFTSKSTSDDDLFSTIFEISMSPAEIFHDLNEDWKVMDNTGNSLSLKDDSNDGNAIDFLTFQKIE